VLTLCVQGSLIALVDNQDLARLVASHKKMRKQLGPAVPALLSISDAAAVSDASLQRETGSAEVFVRAAAAATEPTAGQAMLRRDNGVGALVSTSSTEMLATTAAEMLDGEAAPAFTASSETPATSDTEMLEGEGEPALTAGSVIHNGQRSAPVVKAATGSSVGLAPGCFVVPSINYSMYGKKMRDIHIAGFTMESNHTWELLTF